MKATYVLTVLLIMAVLALFPCTDAEAKIYECTSLHAFDWEKDRLKTSSIKIHIKYDEETGVVLIDNGGIPVQLNLSIQRSLSQGGDMVALGTQISKLPDGTESFTGNNLLRIRKLWLDSNLRPKYDHISFFYYSDSLASVVTGPCKEEEK